MAENDRQQCGCAPGSCFLQSDAAWAKRNYSMANEKDVPGGNRAMWQTLEAERLGKKSEWLEELGVMGVCQVQCRLTDEDDTF